MSSDEDDYMSDKFLTQEIVKNNRPGLIRNRSMQHEHQVCVKKAKLDEESRNRHKPMKVIEKERREEGLGLAVSSSSKGFAMLSRMGYKEGDGLGKTSNPGIVEPIGITVKANRMGLGRDTAIHELRQKRMEIRREKMKQMIGDGSDSTEEFRKRYSQRQDMRQVEAALRNCQKACERLDHSEGIKQPVLVWFWPEANPTKDDDEEQEEPTDDDKEPEYDPHEKLGMITRFLRTTYNFCHWCGVQYNDVDDLMENCPGPNKDDH